MRSFRRAVCLLGLIATTLVPIAASASSGAIIAPNQYAWSDNGGYVNWLASGGNVTVTDTALNGYIWSAGFGWINLAPTNGGVANNNGTLSGDAWGANVGWIDFTGVTIDGSGVFHGHTVAQGTFGTMTFDCDHCSVVTSWRAQSSDTGGGRGTGGGAGSSGSNGPPVGLNSSASTTAQSTVSSLQAQLQALSAQFAGLRASQGATNSSSYVFSRNLQLRDTGADVRALQRYLNAHSSPVARSGAGSAGSETIVFGPATFRALKNFQAAHGLLATGYFGPITRAFIRSQQIQ